MGRVRAYARPERKRLIIHVFAEAIRTGQFRMKSTAEIAREMDITPSSKLRAILREMVADGVLLVTKVEDAGIAGFREMYELNYHKESFEPSHENRKAAKRERTIRFNSGKGYEELTLR